jgi:dipeptidyl aminopeptidase/acylaminoacyl peptidase
MKRFIALASAILGILLVVMTGAISQASASTGSTHLIAFDGSGGIWLVNADGTDLHQITIGGGGKLSFAPDGHRLAYGYNGEIWVTTTAGGPGYQLTHTGGMAEGAAWSPNGRWIAYTVGEHLGSDLFRIRPSGGQQVRMTNGGVRNCFALGATWAPDSATFAYVRVHGSNSNCTGTGLVVQHPGEAGRIVVHGLVNVSPSFTPAGTLVYIAHCGDPSLCGQYYVGWEANADGTHAIMVSSQPECVSPGDPCIIGIVGAPSGRGWVESFSYVGGSPSGDCFQGAYQKAGVVTLTDPQFCLTGSSVGFYAVS